ncbi:MAG: hypothetical protein EXS05_19890 [Planctomycetaceae bacterium]|nr:hypothetical protein [Planctomycetaceae bacterium]
MRRFALVVTICLALSAAGRLPDTALAQRPAPGPQRQDPAALEPESSAARASARQMQKRFKRGRELVLDDNYTEGAQLLQSILDSDEDDFIPSDPQVQSPQAQSPERSLKFEAQALLGGLPPAGREAYEKQFGPIARRLLAAAVSSGDADALGLVTRRFFHTQAGYEAAYRLATDHLDHGRSLTAALGFERLRQTPQADDQFEPMLSIKTALGWQRAGRDDKAMDVLTAFRHKSRQTFISLGGREVALFDDPDKALGWLGLVFGPRGERGAAADQWTMFRGDVRRNAEGSGGSPYLNRSWRASTVEGSTSSTEKDTVVTQAIRDRQQVGVGDDEATVPAIPYLQPLIVDELVVVRGIGDLRAYDLTSGRLVWATGEKDQLLADILRGGGGPQAQTPGASPLALLVGQRIWSDATFGTISTDGDLVFAVEDLGLGVGRIQVVPSRVPMSRDYNRLAAYDVHTGKAVWEVGGPRGDGVDDLAGSFFLGAPLVLDRRLYCLAESGSEVRLLVLEPGNGRLVWSQTLSDDPDVGREFYRRRSGLSPSYDGGILVCTAGSDQVTAVDLTGRSLLWRYRSRNPAEAYDPRPPQFIMQQENQLLNQQMRGGFDQNRWLDSAAIVADGRVLLSPRDAGDLHCVNLLDGSLVWKKPRGEALFVAGVHDGKVLVVGKSLVQALRLTDGAPAWPEPATISLPSGRGFISGDAYHLPLSSAEVATIELGGGRIVSRSRSRRVPGNLIGLRGHVVSQGSDFVEVFKQLQSLEAEVAQTLEDNPSDAPALAVRGEMHLQHGRIREAYADLQRALELKSDDEAVRELLVGSLLEGLRVDFARYRGLPVDFEKLLTTPEQRSAYLWMQATGLQRSGETQAAFEALLRFADPSVSDREQERVDATLTVRRDRLVRSRADQLYAAATPAVRERLDAAWREQSARLRAAHDPAAARRLTEYFGRTFDSHEFEREVIDTPTSGNWLEEEFRLRRFDRSSVPGLAAAATARLVALLLEADRPRDAAPLVARIEREWPDVATIDGKTGRALVAGWRQLPELQRELTPPPEWPKGQVVSEREVNVGNQTGNRSYTLPMEGDRQPFFAQTNVEVSGRWQDFIARDALGRQIWKLTLEGQMQPSNFALNRAYPCDHLLLVSVGPQVMAIDTLGTADRPGARVLWRMNLTDNPNQGAILPRGLGNIRRRMPISQFGDQMGAVGPVTRESVAVLRGRKLLMLEPLTGKPLWVRDGLTPGSELFGDEEFAFVVPPEATDAAMYRVLDGELQGTRPLPPLADRLDLVGRNAIAWQTSDGKRLLWVRDVPTERVVWKHEFADAALVALIEGREAAVLEPNGRFRVLSLADGKTLLDSAVEPSATVQQIIVLKSPEHYVLIGHEPFANGNFQWTQLPPQSVHVNGNVHGFDRATGKKLWTTSIERQGLDLSQPANLPILTFLSVSLERRKNAAGVDSQFSLLCLDKRTGRIVYSDKQANEPLYYVDFAVDIDAAQIELRLFRSTVRLTFTGKPWPDESP